MNGINVNTAYDINATWNTLKRISRGPWLRIVGLLSVCLLLSACGLGQPRKNYVAPVLDAQNVHSGGSQVAFNRSETMLASGGWEGNIVLFDIRKRKRSISWSAHSDTVNGLVFDDRRKRLISAGYDGYIRVWSWSGKLLREVNTRVSITAMAVSKQRQRLVTGHRDGSVRVWRMRSLRMTQRVRLHRRSIRAVALSKRRRLVASSSHDGRVYVWRERSRHYRQMQRPPSDARTLLFDAKSRHLIGGGWFKLFRWRLSDHSLRVIKTEHRGIIKSMDMIKATHQLATISRQTDSAVYIIDQRTGKTLYRLKSHDLCGGFVQVSPGSNYLATTSDDASVRVWDLRKILGRNKK